MVLVSEIISDAFSICVLRTDRLVRLVHLLIFEYSDNFVEPSLEGGYSRKLDDLAKSDS